MERIYENLDLARKYIKDAVSIVGVLKEMGIYDRDEMQSKIINKEVRYPRILDIDFKSEDEKKEFFKKLFSYKPSNDDLRKIERSEISQIRTINVTLTIPDYKSGEVRTKTKVLEKDNIGYLGIFTYFFLFENISVEEISTLYGSITRNESVIDQLPFKLDLSFIDEKRPNNMEVLSDAIDQLDISRSVKRILDTLPKTLKEAYANATPAQKDMMVSIGQGFEALGEDLFENKIMWDNFFGKKNIDTRKEINGKANPHFGKMVYQSTLYRFKDLDSFFRAATGHIKANSSKAMEEFNANIKRAMALGTANGIEIIFNLNSVLIIRVLSFQANRLINQHTKHCIKDTLGQWDHYVNDSNMQYYIYDLSLPLTDSLSTVGCTITMDNKVFHAQNTNDHRVDLDQYLIALAKKHDIPDVLRSYLQPMDEQENKRRVKAKLVNVELSKKADLDIEKIQEYVREYGADINIGGGFQLREAVKANDLDRVRKLVDLGALFNITSSSSSDIVGAYANTFEMCQLIVELGGEVTYQSGNAVLQKLEEESDDIIQFFIYHTNISFKGGLSTIIRTLILQQMVKSLDLLLKEKRFDISAIHIMIPMNNEPPALKVLELFGKYMKSSNVNVNTPEQRRLLDKALEGLFNKNPEKYELISNAIGYDFRK